MCDSPRVHEVTSSVHVPHIKLKPSTELYCLLTMAQEEEIGKMSCRSPLLLHDADQQVWLPQSFSVTR